MVSEQNFTLLRLIGLVVVLFFACDAYPQDSGLIVIRPGLKNPFLKSTLPCKCFVTDQPETYSKGSVQHPFTCEITSRHVSIVEVTVRQKNKTVFHSHNCTIMSSEEMKITFWSFPIKLFERSPSTECVLVTDLSIREKTSYIRISLYCLLVLCLLVGVLYAGKRFEIMTKLRERWRSGQEWDRLPLYVTFRR